MSKKKRNQKNNNKITTSKEVHESPESPALFFDIRSLIDKTRQTIARTVNAELSMLYWNVGKKISEDILKQDRAEYGKQILESLSSYLTSEYGSGWSRINLNRMVRCYEMFPDEPIWSTVWTKLSWSHIKLIISIKDPLKRDFYIEMCKQEQWSVRRLNERINSMLFERTSIATLPDSVIREELDQTRESGTVSPDMVLRSPYLLDFLDLDEDFYETDFESAILKDMHRFLLELGSGFTFIDKQKRIRIDNKNHFIDLLFYNRKLKRLVCVDLKVGVFKPSYKSQMELYLQWLVKHELQEGENPPIGIILCTGKKESGEQIQMLELRESRIHVAEYLTDLPSQEEFQKQLHNSIQRAKKLTERESQED
ncbi:MAG: PDDEXK nuclease domain-containing protein [Phycisphaerales bacterium]|jgi:predicted nuclease of restriction endonuclease-like (RecB) superfamily|nr:PDDEXK nuclease domain-containing protein [Phycisphaerales bacterium]